MPKKEIEEDSENSKKEFSGFPSETIIEEVMKLEDTSPLRYLIKLAIKKTKEKLFEDFDKIWKNVPLPKEEVEYKKIKRKHGVKKR